jgi:glutathione S-transferase
MKLYDYLPSGNGYKARLLLAQKQALGRSALEVMEGLPFPSIRRWLDRVHAQPGHVTIDARPGALPGARPK